METTLLNTKIRRPPLPPDLVARPHLVSRLEEQANRNLTLISAPAGYGKTTLLCEWLTQAEGRERQDRSTTEGHHSSAASHPARVAWVSLDESDNSLDLFVRYVVAALHMQFPRSFRDVLALLAAPQQVSAYALVTAFVNQLDDLGQRVILVLDDYHALHHKTIHEFLSILIQNLPPRLHLVLATRVDPPLPLARARVQRNWVEVRASDLRFTQQEVETFMYQTVGAAVDPAIMTLLTQRSEGWAAGLRLASLSLRDPGDLTNLHVALSGRDGILTAYLVDQALSQQSDEVQTFLLHSSLLDRFCLPLCEILLEDTTSQTKLVLEEIKHRNLFVIPLDAEETWFRYHHIFQDVLRQRLTLQSGKPRVAQLHTIASQWFEANGLLDEALHHALQAGDVARAARLVETYAHEYFDREDWRTVERWLEQLPVDMFDERPLLAMVRAWVWLEQWKMEAIIPLLNQVESHLQRGDLDIEPAETQIIGAYLYTLRSHFAYWAAASQQCLAYAQQALDLAPPGHRFLRGLACMYYANALQALGEKDAAIAFFDEIFEQDGYQSDVFTMRLLVGKLMVCWRENELHQAVGASEYLLGLADTNRLVENTVWAHNILGRVYYEWNQLEQAHLHFARSVELYQTVNVRAALSGHFGLALTYQALGRNEQANQVAMRAREVARGTDSPEQFFACAAFEARLALMQSLTEQAVLRVGIIPLKFRPNMFMMIEIPELTRLQVLIAEGTPDSLQAAEQWHETLHDFCARTHSAYYMTNLLALKALLRAAQGETAAALESLRAAIASARSAQRLRTFVDLGERMRLLLQQVAAQSANDKYIRQILAAFEPHTRQITITEHHDGKTALYTRQPPLDPLTRRELEILALLRTHLSGKQIAHQLSISPLTVEKHTQHIYEKLGVNNRNDAILSAIEAGILQPL